MNSSLANNFYKKKGILLTPSDEGVVSKVYVEEMKQVLDSSVDYSKLHNHVSFIESFEEVNIILYKKLLSYMNSTSQKGQGYAGYQANRRAWDVLTQDASCLSIETYSLEHLPQYSFSMLSLNTSEKNEFSLKPIPVAQMMKEWLKNLTQVRNHYIQEGYSISILEVVELITLLEILNKRISLFAAEQFVNRRSYASTMSERCEELILDNVSFEIVLAYVMNSFVLQEHTSSGFVISVDELKAFKDLPLTYVMEVFKTLRKI